MTAPRVWITVMAVLWLGLGYSLGATLGVSAVAGGNDGEEPAAEGGRGGPQVPSPWTGKGGSAEEREKFMLEWAARMRKKVHADIAELARELGLDAEQEQEYLDAWDRKWQEMRDIGEDSRRAMKRTFDHYEWDLRRILGEDGYQLLQDRRDEDRRKAEERRRQWLRKRGAGRSQRNGGDGDGDTQDAGAAEGADEDSSAQDEDD